MNTTARYLLSPFDPFDILDVPILEPEFDEVKPEEITDEHLKTRMTSRTGTTETSDDLR